MPSIQRTMLWLLLSLLPAVSCVPAAPTGLSLDNRTSTSVQLTWTLPTQTDVYYPITGYLISCQVINNTYYQGAGIGYETSEITKKSSIALSSLFPQVQYRCYVKANTLQGYGEQSSPTIFWTKPDSVSWMLLKSPTVSDRSVTLTLPTVTFPSSLSGYESILIAVQMSSSNRSKLTSTDIETSDDSYITAELPVSRRFNNFTVGDNIAYGGYVNRPLHMGSYTFYIGLKPVTEEVFDFISFSKWKVTIVLGPPTELSVQARNSSSVTLTWIPPLGTDPTNPITEYWISCTVMNSTYNSSAKYKSFRSSRPLTTLTPLSSQVQYICYVKVSFPHGSDDWSDPIDFWTKPAEIRWNFFNENSKVIERLVTLTLPTPLQPDSLAGYESLLIAAQMSSSISSKLTSTDIEIRNDLYITTQLPVSRLTYKFTVGDSLTYGGYVNRPLHMGSYTFYIGLKPVTEKVVDFTSSPNWQVEIVPAGPTELSVHTRNSTTALLTWKASTWTDVDYPIMSYQVVCDIRNRTYNPLETRYSLSYFNTRLLSITLASLKPQVQYRCYVQAVLSVGYGELSSLITFWTKPVEVEWSFSEEQVVNAKLVTLTLPKVTYPDSLSGYESLLIAAQMSSSISSKLTSADIGTRDDSYITAELPVSKLSDKFTVGDNIAYGGYMNRPLHMGNYTFYIGLKPVTEDVVDFTSISNWQVEIVPTEPVIAPVTLRSSDSALLEWTIPGQLNSNSSVRGYEISCFIRNSTYNPAANSASPYLTENNLSANVTSLFPQVQYSCQVRAHLSNGYGQWSKYTVFWTKPAAIEWSFSEQKPVVNDTLVTLTLPTQPPTLNLQSPPGYESLLIAVQKKSRVKRELSSADIETTNDSYITAELPLSSLSNIFTIGDKNTYGSYLNRPLQFGNYTFYIGLKPVTEEVADFATSPYWQIEIVAPPANSFQNAALIGGTGGGFAIILLIAVILVVLLLRKRSRKGSEKAVGVQHTGLEMSSVNAMRRSRHIEEEAAEPLLHTNEDKNLYANVGLGTPNTTPILVSELHLIVQQAKEDNPDSPFKDEYSQIGHPKMACNDGKKTENAKKNRFKDIMAPDTTRVKLTIANDSDTDYINANYIQDAKKKNKFIACQGPIDQTIEDMWRMIHDTNSSTIVMLTNPVEANRAKCSIYYPEREISCEVFGRFEVRLVEEQRFAEYTIRKLEYTFGERTRTVRLFHFTAWPDHGVPTTAGLLDFRHRVKQEMAINTGPTIVHCSAGVGRTGTFIALDLLIEEAMNQPKKSESKVNVAACVHRMRLQRPKMIQTAEQYAFLYEVLVEALVCGETAVTCAQFDEKLIKWRNRNGKEKCTLELMFDRSKITCSPITDDQFSAGKALENRDRNRDQSVLPLESHRILLPESQINRTGYINAISCNGYHTKSGLIVTQTPLAHTEHDFWNMLLRRESAVIVHLNNNEDEQPYWPYEPGTQTAIRDITVQCLHRNLGSDSCSETELCVVQQGKRLDVLLIDLQVPNRELPNTTQLLTLCRKIERYASSSRDTITIQCSNGNRLSGLFVVAMNLFLRARIEQEVDIILEVKLARRSRPEFINDFASFNLLHEFVTSYLSEFSEYSNFK